MNRRRDLFLTVTGTLFFLVGVPMTLDVGWSGVPAIVLGLGLLVMPVAGRIAHGRPRVDGQRVLIDAMQATVWGGRIVLTLAGACGVVWFVVDGSVERWIGLAMTIGVVFVLGSHIRSRAWRSQIVIDADGVRWQDVRLTWEDLTAARTHDLLEAKYLEPGGIPLEAFPVHPKKLANALRDWARNPGLRAELGTPAALARLDLAPEARQPVELQADKVGEHR